MICFNDFIIPIEVVRPVDGIMNTLTVFIGLGYKKKTPMDGLSLTKN